MRPLDMGSAGSPSSATTRPSRTCAITPQFWMHARHAVWTRISSPWASSALAGSTFTKLLPMAKDPPTTAVVAAAAYCETRRQYGLSHNSFSSLSLLVVPSPRANNPRPDASHGHVVREKTRTPSSTREEESSPSFVRRHLPLHASAPHLRALPCRTPVHGRESRLGAHVQGIAVALEVLGDLVARPCRRMCHRRPARR